MDDLLVSNFVMSDWDKFDFLTQDENYDSAKIEKICSKWGIS